MANVTAVTIIRAKKKTSKWKLLKIDKLKKLWRNSFFLMMTLSKIFILMSKFLVGKKWQLLPL